MAPERIDSIVAELHELRAKVDSRHEENLGRFARIGNDVATIRGEVRVVIALLVANGALNLASLFQHG